MSNQQTKRIQHNTDNDTTEKKDVLKELFLGFGKCYKEVYGQKLKSA